MYFQRQHLLDWILHADLPIFNHRFSVLKLTSITEKWAFLVDNFCRSIPGWCSSRHKCSHSSTCIDNLALGVSPSLRSRYSWTLIRASPSKNKLASHVGVDADQRCLIWTPWEQKQKNPGSVCIKYEDWFRENNFILIHIELQRHKTNSHHWNLN